MNGAADARGMGGSPSAGADLSATFVDLDTGRALLFATETACPRLSPEDHARAERRGGDIEDLARWRAARIATRIVLERIAGAAIRNADFVIADGGRPELPTGLPYFSVSHSGRAALIAVSRVGPVGIDIEGGRTLSMSLERRQRVIAAAVALEASSESLDPERDGDVLRAWVRLEAVAKALGSGIGRLLTAHGVIGQSTGAREGDQAITPRIADLSVPDGYVAAVAAAALAAPVPVLEFPTTTEALSRYLLGE